MKQTRPPKQFSTSWGKHAQWYKGVVQEKGSYQYDVILPNLLRMLNVKKGEVVLDLACGEGFFSRELYKLGVQVTGVDIAPELIEIAKKTSPKEIMYHVGNAENLHKLQNETFDAAIIVLALQNMETLDKALREVRRVLKPSGRLIVVLNHPVLRIPKLSGWGWDEKQGLQYRHINGYMSENKIPIEMHPGKDKKEVTWSFHRPLELYFKALHIAGFCVSDLEEWISHKKSQPGPKAKAEDRAREEFPLFMAIAAQTMYCREVVENI